MTGIDLVIDGDNLLMRALRAVEATRAQNGVSNSGDAAYPGAMTVFVNMLAKNYRQIEPSRVLICWDGEGPIWRQTIFPGYKSNRSGGSEDSDGVYSRSKLHDQAWEFCRLSGIPQVCHPVFEADDLIGALWRRRDDDTVFVILSGDRDFAQLLDLHPVTFQQHPDGTRVGSADVVQKWGCSPEHIPLLRALIGDASDGIDGIHRVGPKTAIKLLKAADFDFEELFAFPAPVLANQPEAKNLVLRNLALMDLRTARVDGLEETPAPQAWSPQRPSEDLLGYLQSLGLPELAGRLLRPDMWSTASLASRMGGG